MWRRAVTNTPPWSVLNTPPWSCTMKHFIHSISQLPENLALRLFGFTTTVSSGLLSQNLYKCAQSFVFIRCTQATGRSGKLSYSEAHQFTFLTHQWQRSRSLRLLAATSIIFPAMFCTLEHNHRPRNMLHLWQWITEAADRFQAATGAIASLQWVDEGGRERWRSEGGREGADEPLPDWVTKPSHSSSSDISEPRPLISFCLFFF